MPGAVRTLPLSISFRAMAARRVPAQMWKQRPGQVRAGGRGPVGVGSGAQMGSFGHLGGSGDAIHLGREER